MQLSEAVRRIINIADERNVTLHRLFLESRISYSTLTSFINGKKDISIKLPVLLASYYGLRRSEALGIKWDAVDFENKTIIIRHTISQTKVDGKLQTVAEDKTKNQSSYRI